MTLDLAAEAVDDGTYGRDGRVGDGTALRARQPRSSIDRVTQAPAAHLPAGGATVSGALAVGYTLPEPALSGSVRARAHPRGAGCRRRSRSRTRRRRRVAHDRPRRPGVDAGVASAVPASPIADGTYDVSLRYRDRLGNPVQSATAAAGRAHDPAEVPAPTRTPGMIGTSHRGRRSHRPRDPRRREIVTPAFTPAHPSRARFRPLGVGDGEVRPRAPAPRAWVRVAASTHSAHPRATRSSASRTACATRATG